MQAGSELLVVHLDLRPLLICNCGPVCSLFWVSEFFDLFGRLCMLCVKSIMGTSMPETSMRK